jgi:hypothetical protein
MTPPELLASAAGDGVLAGFRPSSEVEAYGGIVSVVSSVTHPAAKAIAHATIAAGKIILRIIVI